VPELAQMPDIPGIEIIVDDEAGSVVVRDPVAKSRDKDRIAKILEKLGVKGNTPQEERVYDNVSPEKLEEWHNFTRFCVKNGFCHFIEGELPEAPKVKAKTKGGKGQRQQEEQEDDAEKANA
jgi:hypothetical protein